MPAEPAQQAIAVFELCLLLSGVALVIWLLSSAGARTRWLDTTALPPYPASLPELLLCGALVFLTGFGGQAVVQLSLGPAIARAQDQPGLALFAYSVANYAGALVAWRLLFPSLRHSWVVGPVAPPPAALPLSWDRALRYGAGALLVALPLLTLVSLGWTAVAEKLGLPVEPQDVIATFANTRSPLVIAGMLLVACVFAPVYEELLFRAGLYRFCRQKLGRGWALVISGICFGALHQNWAGFLPLALLGMGLALVYEATGSIRVPIIAHGLFNLNTVLILLSGLPQVAT